MIAKLIITIGVAVAFGATGGVVITHQRLASEVQSLQEANEQLEINQSKLERQAAHAEERADRLDRINGELRAQAATLTQRLEQAQEAQQAAAEEESEDSEMLATELDMDEGETPAPDAPGRQQAAMAGRDRGERRGRDDGLTDEERAERREQWRERVDERISSMRAELQETMDERIRSTNDPAARRRLAEIAEYSQDLFDWGRLIREAEGEERDAYRQHMRETTSHVRSLVEEQREHMLRDLASEYGITDPQQQRSFLRQLERTQSDEFFERDIPISGRVMRGMRRRR